MKNREIYWTTHLRIKNQINDPLIALGEFSHYVDIEQNEFPSPIVYNDTFTSDEHCTSEYEYAKFDCYVPIESIYMLHITPSFVQIYLLELKNLYVRI